MRNRCSGCLRRRRLRAAGLTLSPRPDPRETCRHRDARRCAVDSSGGNSGDGKELTIRDTREKEKDSEKHRRWRWRGGGGGGGGRVGTGWDGWVVEFFI